MTPATSMAIEVRPTFGNCSINFHDKQVCPSFRHNGIEIAARVMKPGLFQMKYSVIPGFTFSETIIPRSIIRVGDTEFGKKLQRGSGTQQQKPVDMEWSFRGAHRVEVIGLLWRFPVRPAVILECKSFSVNATGEKNGKAASDSETLSKFFVGLGGVIGYASDHMGAELAAVAGPGFSRIEAGAHYRIFNDAVLSAGYYSEQNRFDKANVRNHGPYLSVLWPF